MPDPKPGVRSTEWWGIAAVIALAGGKMLGIFPQDATVESVSQQTLEAAPIFVNGVIGLAKQNSALLVAGGLAWSYLKYRTRLKAKR